MSPLAHNRQELRDRLVPTNDETLVRTIRNLLLNVDDPVPMIPLTRPKPTTTIDDSIDTPARDTLAAAREATASIHAQTKECSMKNDKVFTKEAPKRKEADATMNQWNCDFSISSNDSSSKLSAKSEPPKDSQKNEKTTSNDTPERKMSGHEMPVGGKFQSNILQNDSHKHCEVATEIIQMGDPPQVIQHVVEKEDHELKMDVDVSPLQMQQVNASESSSTSSGSSDDDSLSTSSSDSSSETKSSSSSSSSSTSSSSSMSS